MWSFTKWTRKLGHLLAPLLNQVNRRIKQFRSCPCEILDNLQICSVHFHMIDEPILSRACHFVQRSNVSSNMNAKIVQRVILLTNVGNPFINDGCVAGWWAAKVIPKFPAVRDVHSWDVKMIEKILSAGFIYEGRFHATLFVLIQKLLDEISAEFGLNKKKRWRTRKRT